MSAGTPSHFEVLGLPAHADDVAIRRAYATALRAIDPERDPEAFARLRAAYVAARASIEQEGAEETPDEPVSSAGTSADNETPGPAMGVDPTVTLAWRFAADVGARGPTSIPSLLDGALAELRLQYIDAPGQFEEYLIDLIGLQRIAFRADVFAAAEGRFHWSEVGHLASLGERGRWVEQVLSQREAWLALDAGRRNDWHALFEQASRTLDARTVRRWPEVFPLHERFPAWISLLVSTETLEAWQAAFDALPHDTRDEYARMAPGAQAYMTAHQLQARDRASRRASNQAIAFFVLALVVGLAHQIFSGMHGGGPSFAGYGSMRTDSAERCAALRGQLDAPDAFDRLSNDDADELKARAHRCALAGLWAPQAKSP